MLDELFKFPIVLIDGENEERKEQSRQSQASLGLSSEDIEDCDLIYGEAEYPYWDFIGIEDRWLPSKESLEKALDGVFEACVVRFINVGQVLVPWTKKKFKNEINKFQIEYVRTHPPNGGKQPQEVKILNITPEQFHKITTDGNDSNGGE
jgi:hypothetical protein